MMLISVKCPCGKKFRVKEEAAGKRIRCPACQEPIRIPVQESSNEEFEDTAGMDDDSGNESEETHLKQIPGKPKKRQRNEKKKRSSESYTWPMYLAAGLVSAVIVGGAVFIAMRIMHSNQINHVDLTAFDYGPPPPVGTVLSASVIGELAFLRAEEAVASGKSPDPALNESTAKLVREVRASNPQAFCYTSDEEKLMAAGEGDRVSAQKDWDVSKKTTSDTSVEPLKVYQKMHQAASEGKLSVARTRALTIFVLIHLLDKLS